MASAPTVVAQDTLDRMRFARQYRQVLLAFVAEAERPGPAGARALAAVAHDNGLSLSEVLALHTRVSADLMGRPDCGSFFAEIVRHYDTTHAAQAEKLWRAEAEVAALRWGSGPSALDGPPLGEETADGALDPRSEVAALERQILERSEALHRSDADLRSFIGALSHDLLAPVATISMNVDDLRSEIGWMMSPEALDSLEMMNAAVERMRRQIEDMRRYVRIVGSPAPRQRVSLGPILGEVLAAAADDLRDAEVFVGDVPNVIGCPDHLKLLFELLISNAVKFRASDRPLSLEIRSDREAIEGSAVISVRDNGIGIDEAHLERIFDLFARLNDHNSFPGSGMGLTICKRIVTKLSGEIAVRSRVGDGTSFDVRLVVDHNEDDTCS
ncbi:MAG: ATP-binding protein [Pseudomonadota bacterium]